MAEPGLKPGTSDYPPLYSDHCLAQLPCWAWKCGMVFNCTSFLWGGVMLHLQVFSFVTCLFFPPFPARKPYPHLLFRMKFQRRNPSSMPFPPTVTGEPGSWGWCRWEGSYLFEAGVRESSVQVAGCVSDRTGALKLWDSEGLHQQLSGTQWASPTWHMRPACGNQKAAISLYLLA